MGNMVDSILFQPPEPSKLKESKILWIETSTGTRIPSFFIEHRPNSTIHLSSSQLNNRSRPMTILYSHANAEDLGYIYPWCKFLSKHLGVNIIAYDYTGYGLAYDQGPPTEIQCYADIDAVYKHLRNTLQIPASHIILYGRSLGSGPSCYLAARTSESKEEETVGGLILHAPFLSVYRIVIESGCTLIGDQFPNVDYLCSVETPTLLIHGMRDRVVPPYHSQTLLKTISPKFRAPPLFVEDMGHNSVQYSIRHAFIEHLAAYIQKFVKPRASRQGGIEATLVCKRTNSSRGVLSSRSNDTSFSNSMLF